MLNEVLKRIKIFFMIKIEQQIRHKYMNKLIKNRWNYNYTIVKRGVIMYNLLKNESYFIKTPRCSITGKS